MGLLSNAETPYGSGVLYGVTTTIKLPVYDKITNAKLVNEMNKFIALAPQKERWVVQLGSVVYSGVKMANGEAIAISKNSKEENSFNDYSINCFLLASAIRNNDYTTRERATILSNWAIDWLATGIYLEEFFDNI
jgi:hypothetical protein